MNDNVLTASESVSRANTSADTKTDKPWLFKAGQPSPNPLGRPRKGETIAEKVARADAKVARKAIRARDRRLQLENAVGERAWSTYLAYNLGLPKQEYVITNGDDPLTLLFSEIAERRQLPEHTQDT